MGQRLQIRMGVGGWVISDSNLEIVEHKCIEYANDSISIITLPTHPPPPTDEISHRFCQNLTCLGPNGGGPAVHPPPHI